AASRASILPSMATLPSVVAVVEHLRVAGLVSAARRQEPFALDAALLGGGRALRFCQRIGAAVCRDDRDQVGKLLRLEGKELVARLRGLQRPCRALALADQRGHLGAVAVYIADDASLHAHGVLQ